MRYIPGSVLEGGIPVDVDVEADVEVVEGGVKVVEEEEEATPVDCCCVGVDTLLPLCAAESPPATPPAIAPPNSTTRRASTMQNVRVANPQMRDDDVGDSSGASAGSHFTF
jgi:hypothetical protein